MIDALDYLKAGSWIKDNLLIIKFMDNDCPGWASATATDVEWDKIALGTDSWCNHTWKPWPLDYKRLCCTQCGEEKLTC